MKANPMNVLNLLLAVFQPMNIPETPVTTAEIEIADGFQNVLQDAMTMFLTPIYVREYGLGFQEEFKDWQHVALYDNEFIEIGNKEYNNEDKNESIDGKKNAQPITPKYRLNIKRMLFVFGQDADGKINDH